MNEVEFGWAQAHDDEWCARQVGVVSRMVCGRKVGFVPVVQPDRVPEPLHDVCRQKLRELAES